MISGVTTNSGVVLSAEAEEYLRRLRTALPSSVQLHVTSGTRTAQSQAQAMLDKATAAEKLGRSAYDELHAIYKNDALIDVLLALPRELTAWTTTIAARAAAGEYISAHQRGRSFDLRSSVLDSSSLSLLKNAISSSGGKYLVEDAPPHIHVDVPDGDPSTWRAVSLSGSGSGWGLAALALLAALGIGGVVWSRS
jgi:hypothetical protein